jgi:two-component system nitrogen regulation response regulator GlnG
MGPTNIDDSTLDSPRASASYDSDEQLALMIAWHPDPSRVGELATLFGPGESGVLMLNRHEPSFRAAGGAASGPLATPWVSRVPIRLELSSSGELSLSAPEAAQAFLDEAPLARREVRGATELQRGVRLRLGEYVLLWLGTFRRLFAARQGLPGVVGRSAAMQRLELEVRRIADLNEPVLVRGESGTGKELVAAALHQLSPRARGPYVCLNMAAIPASVAASELFGHGKGAFTGASLARAGYFARASSGTLFLDEIGQTAPEVQPVLLRVLESKVIQPIGGELRPVDVRVVAATDSDLEQAVAEGKFQAPLLRRFGYPLVVPPLRERIEDVPELFVTFLREAAQAMNEPSLLDAAERGRAPLIAADFVSKLLAYGWPSNVRELRTLARRVALLGRERTPVSTEEALAALSVSAPAKSPEVVRAARSGARAQELSEAELVHALREHGFGVDATAKALGVSRSWLHDRLNQLNGVRKGKDLRAEEIERALRDAGGDVALAAAALNVSLRALKLQIARLGISPRSR